MRSVLIAMSLFTVLWCIGCDTTTDPSGQGEIRMYMVDSPAEMEAVVVAVSRVEVHMVGSDSVSGWRTVNDQPASYDLLTLRNGASAVLGGARLDAGHYTQIRLILGAGSYVTVDGTNHDLEVASGFQTGVKLNHQFRIEAGETVELYLDFDAERSVREENSGSYRLHPVIRVQRADSSGSISGSVTPLNAGAYIWTTVGEDTVSTYAEADGSFKLMAMPEGAYTVNVESMSDLYFGATVPGVVVTRLNNTNMGSISLTAK
ncbi:MAG: DUF4382 domain-containing protein [Ignavibacteriae bacterium]|nr:DUF4382 domain-containing protein [Ignavibacteriota bacterium]